METANKPKKKEKRMGREILSWAGTLAAALVIALVIRSFVFTLIAVKGCAISSGRFSRSCSTSSSKKTGSTPFPRHSAAQEATVS